MTFNGWMYIENLMLPLEKSLVFFGSNHSKEFLNTRSVVNFYTKALKRFPEKYFRWCCEFGFPGQIAFSQIFDSNWNKNVNFRQIFKISLINGDSFLQMYHSDKNCLTYWFLKVKWLFAKSVKITKKIAIHKNGFQQSF